MRRAILGIAIVAVLGFATSVAIAWAIAALTPPPMYPRTNTGSFVRWDGPWNAVEAHRFGLIHIWWGDLYDDEPVRSVGAALRALQPKPPAEEVVTRVRAEAEVRENDRRGTEYWLRIRNRPRPWGTFAQPEPPPKHITMGSDAGFGWPLPCLWYQIYTTFNPITMSTTSNELRGGYILSGAPASRWDGYRVLPLRPIWVGLALNTALYAAVWAFALFVPGHLRTAVRIRRGRCARCGYTRSGIPEGQPCPECGAASR
jgi:hypothetical protein